MPASPPSIAQDWKHLLKDFLEGAMHPLVVILGPTASGKTAFAMEIAKECKMQGFDEKRLRVTLSTVEGWHARSRTTCHGSTVLTMTRCPAVSVPCKIAEVVNADSRQLYRHLDIGTAKIMREEMCGVPHHLIDVLDPKEEVTAAWYKEQAQKAIDGILKRGHVPLLVGGSMLYLSAIVDDLRFPASADPALRSALLAEYDADGGEKLYARLMRTDPVTARSIHPHNKPYLIRALEIAAQTGKAPSVARTKGRPRYDLFIFGMDCPREELADRIRKRTHAMFEAGWVEEVRGLTARGYGPEDPGMKSLGYREIMEALQSGSCDQAALEKIIAMKSMQYAKRQMTWWRRDSRIRWIAC